MTNSNTPLSIISPARRSHVQSALRAVFDSDVVTALQPLSGGASGAALYRLQRDDRSYVLRLDRLPGAFGNPQRGYACMRIAADAGIAPRLHHTDADSGIAIMDFVVSRPLFSYPGGQIELVRALGSLFARLQAAPLFAPVARFDEVIAYMFGELRRAEVLRPGVLDRHHGAFERIREVYPWAPAGAKSSHNDPNPTNILFDGARLWLIDWEAAYPNEPLADIANVALQLETTPEEDTALLTSWQGQAPDQRLHARFVVLRQLCRLYYACLALEGVIGSVHNESLSDALTRQQLLASFAAGGWQPGAPGCMLALGKSYLAAFSSELHTPILGAALSALRTG